VAPIRAREPGCVAPRCGVAAASGGNPGYFLGTTEPLEQDALATHLASGGCLDDVGANLGFFCILAGRIAGSSGQIYAFEPHPRYAARIAQNAERNRFKNIEVIPAAVADHAGRMSLRVEGVPCPHLEETVSAASEHCIEVDVVTIDALVATRRLRPPTYVIIDAEGTELKVLAGMRETIRAHRPVIMVKVHWLGQAFEEYVDRHLRPLGYVLTNLDARQAVPKDVVRYHALLTPSKAPASAYRPRSGADGGPGRLSG
jgi:FkbM family methyltransferase